MMRNIRITLEYDGTAYRGWQRQVAGMTIQDVLEQAAGKLFREPVVVIGSGRTDAGVHAIGQAANFRTTSSLPAETILKALNSMLPRDIAVRSAEEVDESFHARYHALSKRYRYIVYNGPVRSPLFRNRAWHISRPLDVDAMHEAASHLAGQHDFTTFCGAGSDTVTRVRTVLEAGWFRRGDLCLFEIEADGFLRYMVRSIAGTLVDVGTGSLHPAGFKTALEAGDRTQAGRTAPPDGLYLQKVRYR